METIKVVHQWIFKDKAGKYQVLYECFGEDTIRWFATTNGGFGQTDTELKRISVEEATQITSVIQD